MKARRRLPLPRRALAAPVALLLAACAAVPGPPAPGTAPAAPPAAAALPGAEELLARGRRAVASAQEMQAGNPWGIGPFEAAEFRSFYDLARSDFISLLERYPGSPEAPEALFMLGLINDFPHLNDFQEAVDAYRATVRRFPGTDAARRAAERLDIIDASRGAIQRSPHGGE